MPGCPPCPRSGLHLSRQAPRARSLRESSLHSTIVWNRFRVWNWMVIAIGRCEVRLRDPWARVRHDPGGDERHEKKSRTERLATSKQSPPYPHPPTHAPDQRPHVYPGTHASPQTTPFTRSSSVVVTVVATAPRRGSSEGASLTASVTALLRVPGGAEVSGFGVRSSVPVPVHVMY